MTKSTLAMHSTGIEGFGAPHSAEPVGEPRHRRRQRDAEQREFRVARGLLFAAFLFVALLGRLLPPSMRPLPGSGARRSVFAEARAAANEITPFLFSR
ncbi:MAG: hypothetical protein ACFCUN_06125 [Hyphomicrobiaceae bacterium]